jgi:hypothetical protein
MEAREETKREGESAGEEREECQEKYWPTLAELFGSPGRKNYWVFRGREK